MLWKEITIFTSLFEVNVARKLTVRALLVKMSKCREYLESRVGTMNHKCLQNLK